MPGNFVPKRPASAHRRLWVLLGILLCAPLQRVVGQTFNQIQFVIATGGDDLRGDSSGTVTSQAANGATLQVIEFQNQESWDNNSTHTVTAALKDQDIRQVWFAGVHSDVGGFYVYTECGLSQISLEWMLSEAVTSDLIIDPNKAKVELGRVSSPSSTSGTGGFITGA